MHGNKTVRGAPARMEPRRENGSAATGRQLCRTVNASYDALRGRPLSSPARSSLSYLVRAKGLTCPQLFSTRSLMICRAAARSLDLLSSVKFRRPSK